MLSDTDAELVRNDPTIPGLRLLLDADAFGKKVSQHWPQLKLARVEAQEIRYEKGKQCKAAFQLHTQRGGIIRVYAKAYNRDDAPNELMNAKSKSYAAGDEGMTVRILSDFGLVIYAHPNDKVLDKLIHTYDPDQLYDLLRTLFPLQPTWWAGELETISYTPERCLVARLIVHKTPRAVIKFYAPERYQELIEHHQELSAIEGIGTPKVLGHSNVYHAVGYEWLPGVLLSRIMIKDDQNALKALYMTGKALAKFHREASGNVDKVLDRHSHATELKQQARLLCSLSPELCAPANELASILSERLRYDNESISVIHGAFHYRHALLSRSGVSILDLDTLALGDPTSDLGNFIAHLERNVLRGRVSAAHTQQYIAAFLKGYGEVNITRLDLYAAASLFKLAANPFIYREEDWQTHSYAMIKHSRRLLTRLDTSNPASAANSF